MSTKNLFANLRAYYGQHPWLFGLRTLTIAAVVALFVVRRTFWTPDMLFLILLAIAIVFGQARQYIVRFLPFVALLLVYESFRGVADNLSAHVHYTFMIDVDRFLFDGYLPTAVLQQWWWHGTVSWYDFYFYFLYTLHFVAPLLLAVLLWKRREKSYLPFVSSLVLLSFMAFATYLVFPAAPPWMASDQGYIQPIHRISSDTWQAMHISDSSEIYSQLSPNPVAAVPSLHAAYPLLFVLTLAGIYGWRRTWWLMVYPVSVWIGIVYLGEHYVTDALLGILYAIVAYKAIQLLFAWKARRDFSLRAYGRRLLAYVVVLDD